MDHRRVTGTGGEEKAAAFLEARGVRVLERNYRSRYGEIDLLAKDGRYLIAVEVKTRRTAGSGTPAEAVGHRKIMRICRTFNRYRMEHRIPYTTPARFDVLEVKPGRAGDEFHWIKNAFEYIE